MSSSGKARRAVVIGSGFAGLAAACCLAQEGWSVTVLEKNAQLGGRARTWEQDGFTFDMGPSWYWMPDVFEEFFARFGKKSSDYYDLVRLDPSYRVFFGPDDVVDMPTDIGALLGLFESIEPGAATALRRYLAQAEYKYQVGMGDYVRRPSLALSEFFDARMALEAVRLQMFQPIRSHIARSFQDERLRRLLEFPILFLGGTGREIPAMYSMMNHADMMLGTWYPVGGMRRVADAMIALARDLGVTLCPSEAVRRINITEGVARGVETDHGTIPADVVIAGADYHHAEQELVAPEWRTYDEAYWKSRVLSPSSLLFYLGVNRRLKNLRHHNLFFDEGLEQHADEIYRTPKWPTKPLFYACVSSQTDPSVAPEGCENLFLLVPLAPGLDDPETVRERYYHLLMDRLEGLTSQPIRDAVVVKRSYAHKDFIADYHSYKGNAYGLANTLKQTAVFKPRMKAKKVRNLYYAGQLTVPGPGVPPSLLSGQIAASIALQENA